MNYQILEQLLKQKNVKKTDLVTKIGLSSTTVAKIGKNLPITLATVKKIASFLGEDARTLYQKIMQTPSPVLFVLQNEMQNEVRGGLYHEVQVRLTYNSNHIEGSKLTEQQTRNIYETNTLGVENGHVNVDDVLETVQHFRLIDYVIEHANDNLSQDMIKTMHRMLKQNTSDALQTWFGLGEYKKRPNTVGGKQTTAPNQVEKQIKKLLGDYGKKSRIDLQDVVEFHYGFEKIHPFQDGNGRIGRLIMLKECLKNGIVPFIIENDLKHLYYNGLSKFEEEKGYLIETCLYAQDMFKKLLDLYEVKY